MIRIAITVEAVKAKGRPEGSGTLPRRQSPPLASV
jgi:hypothetical protein